VAISRRASWEIPTCTEPYAVRCKCRFARNDMDVFTSLRAAAGGVAISRTTAAEAVWGERIYPLGGFATLRWGILYR